MARHCHWRDCKEWSRYNLPFSSTSNESCKLYDAALTQLLGFYNDHTMGGLAKTCQEMLAADPQNVMGHVFTIGLDLVSEAIWPRLDDGFRKKLTSLVAMAEGPDVTNWEKRHVKALQLWADGYTSAAGQVWEDILVDHPYDMLASRFMFDVYLYMGKMPERRDCNARTVAQWTDDMPNYGYLLGMYAFSLNETNDTNRAEVLAKQALELNPWDAWSTHALAHVYETERRYGDGVELLDSTQRYWTDSEFLACHNAWHWGLYNVEKGNYDEALDIFDTQVAKRALKMPSNFAMTDVSSLLFRLQLEEVAVSGRWQQVYSLSQDRLTPHQVAFSDPHIVMSCVGAGRGDLARTLIDDLQAFSSGGASDVQRVKRDVSGPLCEAVLAYMEGDYAHTVSTLRPLRYEVYKIGGSNAQRDIFNQLLIQAALKSDEYQNLAKCLVLERKQQVQRESPLTNRMTTKLVTS